MYYEWVFSASPRKELKRKSWNSFCLAIKRDVKNVILPKVFDFYITWNPVHPFGDHKNSSGKMYGYWCMVKKSMVQLTFSVWQLTLPKCSSVWVVTSLQLVVTESQKGIVVLRVCPQFADWFPGPTFQPLPTEEFALGQALDTPSISVLKFSTFSTDWVLWLNTELP